MKASITYNELTGLPELVFDFNTASEKVEDKLLRKFSELSIDTEANLTRCDILNKPDGTSTIRIFTEAIPPTP